MRVVVLAVLLAVLACRIDLDHGKQMPTMPTVDGANNTREQCAINTVSPLCTNAVALTDCSGSASGCFTYIKANIFDANCKSGSCHSKGGTGKLDLSSDADFGPVTQAQAYANLMGSNGSGAASLVDTSRLLVVPGHPEQSYLDLMVQEIGPMDMVPPASDPPANVGYMPQASGVLCCQKLDLIDRWIRGGAKNN